MSQKREKISSASNLSGDLVIITRFSDPNFVPDGFHLTEDGDEFLLTSKGKAYNTYYSISPENMEILKKLDSVLVVFTTPDDRLHEAMATKKGLAS
ncbi:hypothetical protein [Acetobacter persici]|uniref:Uncharacterized protein n=1 Tax=Acetobacter persici TaxID=1076596 RepID=A0A1U9LIX8_9PROT|nr:hypothetical protein [Acetobacter persici]AQT06382.1 hypothetical protein A0U91_15315 [Acetobacter persici]